MNVYLSGGLFFGRGGRLTQVGIRASGKDQSYWESNFGVRQFWAKDILQDPARAIDEVIAHVKSTGVTGVYFSNNQQSPTNTQLK